MIKRMKQFRTTPRLIGRCLILLSVYASCGILVGCNGYNSPNSSPSATSSDSVSAAATAADADPQASAPAAPSDNGSGANGGSDGWQLGQKTSPMDGEIVQALRTYHFANDSDMLAQVEFTCTVQTQKLAITIESFVGGTDHPDNSSAYQLSPVTVLGNAPDGRLKFGDSEPKELWGSFSVGRFANLMEMDVSANEGISIGSLSGATSNNDGAALLSGIDGVLDHYTQLKHIQISANRVIDRQDNSITGRYNAVAALSYLFPISVEFINGRGTYDVVIDKSDSVSTVLNNCGASKAVIDPSLILSAADIEAAHEASAQAEQDQEARQEQQAAQTAAYMKWQSGERGANLLYRAVRSYIMDHNNMAPGSLQDLLTLPPAAYRPGTTSSNGFRPYATSADLIDPFGKPYGYVRDNPPWRFHVYFYGEDGVLGGTGLNSDCVEPESTTMTCRILPVTAQESRTPATAPASAQTPNLADEPPVAGATDQPAARARKTQSLLSASFDCTRASSPTERAICSDATLSDFDGRMAVAYKQLLSRDPLALPEQREWMKQRNQCGGDIGCLTSSYQGRLQKIQEIMATINK